MSRNPEIEAIHEARYDLETSAPGDTAVARERLDRLVSEALTRSASRVSPRELLDILHEDYKEFRRSKKRGEWPRI